MLYKYLQNSLYSLNMFFYSPGENQYIVQVYHYHFFYYQIIKYIIYYSLKGGRAVSYTENYHQGFKETMISLKNGFPLIFRLDIYIVKAPVNVQLDKVLYFAQLRDKLRNKKQRILIFNSH